MVEVGYVLKHVDTGRMVFYFQPKDDGDRVPFDLNGFAYDQINDSRELKTKIRLQTIINKVKAGEI